MKWYDWTAVFASLLMIAAMMSWRYFDWGFLCIAVGALVCISLLETFEKSEKDYVYNEQKRMR